MRKEGGKVGGRGRETGGRRYLKMLVTGEVCGIGSERKKKNVNNEGRSSWKFEKGKIWR